MIGAAGGFLRIGRQKRGTSGRHCELIFEGGLCYIVDRSRCGTKVNTKPLTKDERHELRPGDVIEIPRDLRDGADKWYRLSFEQS